MQKKVTAMYFSPTGTTRSVVARIAGKIYEKMDGSDSVQVVDFTLPQHRKTPASFSEADVVVFGVPVYAGRVPNVMVKYMNTIRGNGAMAVAVVVYGNRNYDDALIELTDILTSDGFSVISGGAFIGEHSFSVTLAQGRPDDRDMAIADQFADQISLKIDRQDKRPVSVGGQTPYRKHYMPKNPEGVSVDIRKVKPKTNEQCTDCKVCVAVCPMASIDEEDVSVVSGICIKCGACIKRCPEHAKYFDDADFLRHKEELEAQFAPRKEPELFV